MVVLSEADEDIDKQSWLKPYPSQQLQRDWGNLVARVRCVCVWSSEENGKNSLICTQMRSKQAHARERNKHQG